MVEDSNNLEESGGGSPAHSKLTAAPWLATTGIALIHLVTGLILLAATRDLWASRTVLQMLVDRVPLVGSIPAMWFLLVASIALIALLAVVEVSKALWRWRKGQPEREVALRIRVFIYAVLGCIFFNVFVLSTPESFSGPFRLRFSFVGGNVCQS